MEEIKIILSKNGEVQIGVEGVKGGKCKELTAKIQKALGITVEDKATGEMYENQNQVTDKQGLGRGY